MTREDALDRRAAVVALACLVAAGRSALARAQRSAKPRRIGFLAGSSAATQAPFLAAFKQGMQQLGYEEGRDFVMEMRFADGRFEVLPSLVQELLKQAPDLLFVNSTPGNLAAKAATTTVPIVFVGVADPVGVRLVDNLAHPGGNITGITNIAAELTGKRLEILREIFPRAERVGVLVNLADANASLQLRNVQAAANALDLRLEVLEIGRAAGVERGLATAAHLGPIPVLRMVDPTVTLLRAETASLALKLRVPVMFAFREDVEAGGLVSYGASFAGQYAQAASFVHRIFEGAKPGELPVEQPKRFELVINNRSARALGLAIPRSLLLQADSVLE